MWHDRCLHKPNEKRKRKIEQTFQFNHQSPSSHRQTHHANKDRHNRQINTNTLPLISCTFTHHLTSHPAHRTFDPITESYLNPHLKVGVFETLHFLFQRCFLVFQLVHLSERIIHKYHHARHTNSSTHMQQREIKRCWNISPTGHTTSIDAGIRVSRSCV